MRKKLLTLLLAVAAGIGTMFAEPVQIGDLYYNLDATNQTAEVTYELQYSENNYKGLTTANIPSSVTYNSVSYSVTSIGNYAFYDCSGLTSVTIGNSVTSIGNWTFSGCSGLTSVTIPNSVTSIGEDAFSFCTGLTSPIYNAHIFAYMPTSYSGTYTIPDGIELIAGGAFLSCTGLTSVTIPNSVTSIGERAFYDCTGLTSVTIPNSVTSIGGSAFYGCSSLTSINVVTDNPNYCSVEGVLFNKDKTVLVQCPGGKEGNYTIPNSVTSIESSAFYGCTGLTSVAIPNSVTSIGTYAFYDCTGLTSVTIPNSVTSIGNWTFSGCSGLTSINVVTDNPNYCSVEGVLFNKDKTVLVQCPGGKEGNYTIPNSVTSIGNGAFIGCHGLTSVTIGNSVTSIESSAFSDCTGLTSVTIPNSVTSIGKAAFQDCSGLTSITIGNSVTSIGYVAFFGCFGLKRVDISDLAAWCNITFDDSDAFYSTTNNPLSYANHLYLNGVEITDLVIPNTITSIGDIAFSGCSGLTSVTIPNSVTSIGRWAFNGCSGLTSVTIPNSVTSIGDYAFYDCSGLTSVTIPNSVTSIGKYAFKNCTGLTSLTCFATTPPMMGSNVFYNVNCSKIPLYVPDESIEEYKAAEQWNLFSPILPLSQKPQESEAIDEIIVEDLTSSTKKILHNGQIYILRGDKSYTLQGQVVK